MNPVIIKFWGVRGSIPTPGPRTLRYGGNTACVEITFPDTPRFIIDAGSGIRELGKELLSIQQPVEAYIFLSHFHWDHIQGLPFFKPAFEPGNKFIIFGCDEPNVPLDQIISIQMNPIYFPVAIEDMRSEIEFRTIAEENFNLNGVNVQTKYLNHPGYTLGFRFQYDHKSIVYLSDNEPFLQNQIVHRLPKHREESLESRFETFVEDKEKELIEFLANADVLIHDAQYFPDEYKKRIRWGHSPYTYAVDLAVKGKVKELILFHHDPDHDDETVDKIEQLSQERLRQADYPIKCSAAREGMEIEI
ncbi:MAG: MBL fold metallo-hydrolase [Calditrichaeota bacterium]|nr:MAG: MBL fold metallo-hydrolase [Calditrichota bacterium]